MENNKLLSIEEMVEIEPALLMSETFVKKRNEEAKTKEIYWCYVWGKCKNMIDILVGQLARNTLLENYQYYDIWHDHLKSLATNCK